jgi:phosphohistidine swiveling domain-containing protein
VRAERLWFLDARGMDSGVAAGTLSFVLSAAGEGEAVVLALASSRDEVNATVEAATACGIGAVLLLLCDAAGSSRAASWLLPASAGEGLRVFALRADAGILDWVGACVAAATESDGPSPCCSLAASLSATITAHHSRIIHGRLYNSRAVAAPAAASGYIPVDPSGMLADIAAVTQAFRERVVPQVDALCRRLLAASVRRAAFRRAAPPPRAAAAAQASGSAASDAAAVAAPPGSAGPLQLFPPPVRGADVAAALREYRDACSLSWSIAYFISSAEAAFEEAWGGVSDVAAAYGATREMLLAGLTSRNTLDELQGLGQRQAGNAALLALCRDESIPDGQLAIEIFIRALAEAKATSGDAGAAGDAKATADGGSPADSEELAFSHASPLYAVARDLYSFLGHYGWAADNDQDMNERHWAEDAAFPLGVWRKVVLARAAALASGSASAAHAAGLEAAAGLAGAPGAPPLLRRESSTASAGRYESASAVLQTELPTDHPLWGALEMLRASLLQKERVHTMYVRLGLRAKLMLQQWIDEHWAALAACGCGEAAPAGGGVAREDLNHAPPAYWLAALREGDGLLAGDAGASGGSAGSGARSGAAAMPPAAVVAAVTPAVGPALRALVSAARVFALERRMWAGTEAIVSLAASRGRTQEVAGGVGQASAEAGALAGGAATFAGLGCSSGSGAPVVGRARVITKLEQASSVQAGEVLVTRVTSPAWTPLFSLIAAVVLEEGGMLSHGAVVARECGLACVSQVRGAIAAIATGDLVQVDGEAGTVTVLERRAA